MPDLSPFIAASPGAMAHLQQNPLVTAALKQGIFKDIWGSTYSDFMGMDSSGYGGPAGEIPDNTQGRTQAFSADVSVYRCVDLRGAAIASVPLKIYDSVDPAKRREVDHDAMDVLATSNPFSWVAGPQLMRYSLGSRDLHGSFAWRLVNDTGGKIRSPLPREIYWLPPGSYTAVHGKDMKPAQPKVPFAGLRVKPGDGRPEFFLSAPEVVYAPTYNPIDPLRGTSRITALRTDLNLRLYGANSNLWFFRNNQRPDVVVTGAFSPTVENVSLMRRIWRAAFGGDGSRGPAFLPADMKVQLLTMAAKDAEWLGQRQAAREDILAAFGIPPPVYGDLSRATYENIRVAYEGFWRTGMIPELDEIAAFLTQQFLWKWPDAQRNKLLFSFDYAAIEALQEDANAIWERTMQMLDRLNTAVERRNLLPDQMREIAQMLFKSAGLPDQPWKGKVPGGDMFYVRINDIPLIESSVQATVDANSARAGVATGKTNKPGHGKWTLPDAQDVIVPVTNEGATRAPQPPEPTAPDPPQPATPVPPTPNPVARVIVHNHLTKLNWPELPGEGGLGSDHGVQRDAGTGQTGPHETVRPQLPASTLHAQTWLTRRLKRHFQDQQTAALRALRAAQEASEPLSDPSALVDVQAGLQNASDIVEAALAMAQMTADAKGHAQVIEGVTAQLLSEALLASAEDGESPRAVVDRVREVFRTRIEIAEGFAQAIVGQPQETAA